MSTAEQLPGSEAVDVTKSDSESSEELEVKAIRCIPSSRSRKRTGSQYSRSVASSSPPKRPQSARVRNGATTLRPGSPAPPGSPSKPGDTVPTTSARHRRSRSWVPYWSSRKEAAAVALEDPGVVELTTDASDVQDVNDADKSSKSSKKGWNWFSRQKDTSTAAPVTDDDEELREQGSIAAEASPAKRGASKYLWPFGSKSGEAKNSMLDGAVLSETDTIGGGDVSADENTVDNSRPSSRQGNLTTSSRDGKEDKDEKDEKGKDKKAAKHRRGNSIMDLFRVKALEGAGEGVEDSIGKLPGKKAESSQMVHKTSSLSCFSMPQVVDDEAVVEIIIEGLTCGRAGMRNLGNTCFISAALQCLRATPGLLDSIAYDLLEDPSQLPTNLLASEMGPPLPLQSPTSCGAASGSGVDATTASPSSVIINASRPASPLATSTNAMHGALEDSTGKPQLAGNSASGLVSPSDVQLSFAQSSLDASLLHATSPPATAGLPPGLGSQVDAAVAKYSVHPGSGATSPVKMQQSSPPVLPLASAQLCTPPLGTSDPAAAVPVAAGGLAAELDAEAGTQSAIEAAHFTAPAHTARTNGFSTSGIPGPVAEGVSEPKPLQSASQSHASGAAQGFTAARELAATFQPTGGAVDVAASELVAQVAPDDGEGQLSAPVFRGNNEESGPVAALLVAKGPSISLAALDTSLGAFTLSSKQEASEREASQVGEGTEQEGVALAIKAGESEIEGSEKEKEAEGEEGAGVGEAAEGEQAEAVEAVKEPVPEVTNTELATHIVHAMVRVATGQDGDVMVPQKFCNDMAHNSLGSLFSDGGQHDSHEFLRYVMNVLHEAYDRVTEKPPYEEFLENPDEPPAAKAERLWEVQQSREASPLSDLFQGQLESCVVCSKCQTTFYTYEPFMDLSLSLNKEGKGFSSLFKGKTIDKLEDCFHAFTEDEKLDGNEAFWCSVCEARTAATKVLRIHRFPRALVLHIKRFKMAIRQHVKLSSNVAIPLQGLDLAPFASESAPLELEGAMYDLYALANHSGSVDSGHYTAHAKISSTEDESQPWCLFADDRVHEVPSDDVVSSEAYMMFYVRRPHLPVSAEAVSSLKP